MADTDRVDEAVHIALSTLETVARTSIDHGIAVEAASEILHFYIALQGSY